MRPYDYEWHGDIVKLSHDIADFMGRKTGREFYVQESSSANGHYRYVYIGCDEVGQAVCCSATNDGDMYSQLNGVFAMLKFYDSLI